jgi:hypothetical protein
MVSHHVVSCGVVRYGTLQGWNGVGRKSRPSCRRDLYSVAQDCEHHQRYCGCVGGEVEMADTVLRGEGWREREKHSAGTDEVREGTEVQRGNEVRGMKDTQKKELKLDL